MATQLHVAIGCEGEAAFTDWNLYPMTVWARKGGRSQLVAQAWTPVGLKR